jgi:hypothetical protein
MVHRELKTGAPLRRRLPLAGLLILLSILLALPALAGWQDQVPSGVKVVNNPAEPSVRTSVELNELWRLGGDSEDEDEFFGIITKVLVSDAGEVFVLDSQLHEVKVYDADGVFLRSIGREGEGPGEFRGPNGMFFLPDGNIGVCQVAPARIVILSPEGEPMGDRPVPLPEGAGFALILGSAAQGDVVNLVLGWNEMEEGKFTQHRALMRISEEGEVMHTFAAGDRVFEFAKALVQEKVWDGWENRWNMSKDGHVIANEIWGEYALSVWNADGELEMVFGRDYPHRERSKEEHDRLYGIYEAFTSRQLPDAKIEISDYDQDVFRVYALDNGEYWVNHSQGANDLDEGVMGIFDVFDSAGRYQREVTLKGDGNPTQDGYFFVGDRLFVVTDLLAAAMAAQGGGGEEDEEVEPMGVICYQLPAKLLGGS